MKDKYGAIRTYRGRHEARDVQLFLLSYGLHVFSCAHTVVPHTDVLC
jgi:hypothetical protein